MNTNTEITHSFSRTSAKRYGVNGALLLGYLLNRIRISNNIQDGKRWFYDSIADLAENYPYLSQTAIFNAKRVLTADTGPIITGNYNKWGRDKTTWYSVRHDRTLNEPEDELLYFKVPDAVAYGILEAILMSNLRYWLAKKQEEDPAYLYHAMSPRNLEGVFDKVFSRSSIQRALEHLVEKGVLVPKPPDKANDPISYRFAGPEDAPVSEAQGGSTKNEVVAQTGVKGGSTTNEVLVAQKEVRGSIQNQAGPTKNMTGPSENEVAQIGMKVAHPRVTLPLNNSLKGNFLKEDSLKEDRFKASSVVFSSHSLKPDAELTSGSVSSPLKDSGHNRFSEPIDGLNPATPDQAPVNAKNSSVRLVDVSSTDANAVSHPNLAPSLDNNTSLVNDATLVNSGSISNPASLPNHAPLPNPTALANDPVKTDSSPHFSGLRLPTTNNARIEQLPYYVFLDVDGVHKCCWEVMKFHNENTDPVYQDMADTIVGVAQHLITQTDPAKIHALYQISTQFELNIELYAWSGQFFADIYDQQLNAPDSPDNAHYREIFLAHSLCFLNMAFHNLKFDAYRIYLGPPYNAIAQALYSRMSGWIEQQQAQKRTQTIEQRKIQFASPDQDKESDPTLSAAEKMQVLRQSLQARNRIGKYDEFGQFTEQVVMVTQNTPVLARQFFQLNPHYTVQDINRVIDACLALPANNFQDEEDPQWHARNGYKISLLLNSFTQVATQLNMLSQLPAFTPLPVEDPNADQT